MTAGKKTRVAALLAGGTPLAGWVHSRCDASTLVRDPVSSCDRTTWRSPRWAGVSTQCSARPVMVRSCRGSRTGASGHTWHHRDEVLFCITRLGVAKAANLNDYESAMPADEGVLSYDEIVASLLWIKAQCPAAHRARHDELNRSAGR